MCELCPFRSLQKRRERASLAALNSGASVKVVPDVAPPKRGGRESESYQYVGENSKVHFEMRTQGSLRDQGKLEVLVLSMFLVVGILLAVLGTSTILASGMMRVLREDAVEIAMRKGGAALEPYLIYMGYSLSFVLVAAILTAFAPDAAGSGLPSSRRS